MGILQHISNAQFALQEQLREDWKDLFNDITVKECHNETYLVLSPTGEFLVYSAFPAPSGVTWMSRTLKEYQDELHDKE